jgi:general secretion pathway protein G
MRTRAWQRIASRRRGFTLIELLVVMAIMALLLSIALPKYFDSVDYSKEVALKQNLQTMRYAIDRYRGDRGQYPATLQQLVEARYLREIPVDPYLETSTAWKTLPPPNSGDAGVYDVKSSAARTGRDGSLASSW